MQQETEPQNRDNTPIPSEIHMADPPSVDPPSTSPHFMSTEEATENWDYALVVRDASLCQELANLAAAKRDTHAVHNLCRLASTTPDIWQYLSGERIAWRWARISAINALARIGAPQAIPTLVSMLGDRDPNVRETSAFALPTFHKKSLPHLRAKLRDSYDWKLAEMQTILRLLTEVGDTSIVPELNQVIEQQLPADPSRWAKQTFAWPLYPLLFGLLLHWLVSNFSTEFAPSSIDLHPGIFKSFVVSAVVPLMDASRISVGIIPLLLVYMVLICTIFLPLLSVRIAHERSSLTCYALETIAAIRDKRPISQIVTLALGSDQRIATRAKQTLLDLLPLINQTDRSRFNVRTQEELPHLLGTGSPELDLSLLQALEAVGTSSALPYIEHQSLHSPIDAVRERAKHLLPLFQSRRETEMAAKFLLRSSQSPMSTGQYLVRAADGNNETTRHQLLRSSQSPDSPF